MQALAQLGPCAGLEVLGQDRQQGVADEGQIGQQVGIAGAGAIFSHQDVPPPMIADFHSAPVSPDQTQPLLGPILPRQRAGEVIAGFGAAEPRLFNGSLAPQNDQGSGEREVGCQRLDVEGMQASGFDASVAGLGVGKKGVSFNPSNA